ncbi:MAG: FHA domain-containing protein [archaeon]|nr:FHA domain-containing protein [archaeon]
MNSNIQIQASKDNMSSNDPKEQQPAKVRARNDNIQSDIMDPSIEYINSHREITQKEVEEGDLLILEEDSRGKLFNQKQIKITAAGLIGGRGANDGVSIFGLPSSEESMKENFKVDFEINYSEKVNFPYAFAIYYKTDTKKYYIRAYSGKGSEYKILFVKLTGDYSLPLKQKEIISCADTTFQVKPLENNFLEVINLSAKNESNPEGIKKIFDPNEKKEVTIGRDVKCDFSFNKDKSFSRTQTSFIYDDIKKEWTIMDGSPTKKSTNGTWVFGTHSFPICNQMICQILSSMIQFKLTKYEG